MASTATNNAPFPKRPQRLAVRVRGLNLVFMDNQYFSIFWCIERDTAHNAPQRTKDQTNASQDTLPHAVLFGSELPRNEFLIDKQTLTPKRSPLGSGVSQSFRKEKGAAATMEFYVSLDSRSGWCRTIAVARLTLLIKQSKELISS